MSSIASAPMTRNVTRVFRTATDEQRAAGLSWYADAQRVAQTNATAFGVTLQQSAGILAALSPLNSWGANVNLATRFLSEGGLSSGYLGVGLRQANLILKGENPENILLSQKVRAFYFCIVSGIVAVKVSSERSHKSYDADILATAFPEAEAAARKVSTYNFLQVL